MEESTSLCARLPVELYRSVILHSYPHDLTNICRVSRLFRNEAQPILYGSSDLMYYDYDHILAWSRTIDSRPHLAHMVHFLILPYDLALNSALWARAKFYTSLACALKKTVNLKGISIIEIPIIETPEATARASGRMFTLLPKVLVGCSFRLQSFCGRLSTQGFLEDWWKFFSEQKEIRYWDPVPRIPGHGMILPRDMFPDLTAIVLRQTESTTNTNLLLHLGSRPIQRLSLQWDMSKGNPLYVMKWFVVLADTVTHFNWEAVGPTSPRSPTTLDIILAIIEQLPRLKFIRFSSEENDSVSSHGLINAVSKLEIIETLMLDILVIARSDGVSSGILSEYSSQECIELADMFMVSCPTLHRFSFATPVSSINSGQHRVYPCYARGRDGKVQLEGFNLLDKDSWRDGM